MHITPLQQRILFYIDEEYLEGAIPYIHCGFFICICRDLGYEETRIANTIRSAIFLLRKKNLIHVDKPENLRNPPTLWSTSMHLTFRGRFVTYVLKKTQ